MATKMTPTQRNYAVARINVEAAQKDVEIVKTKQQLADVAAVLKK